MEFLIPFMNEKDNEVFRAPEQNLICIGSREIPMRFWQSLKCLNQWDFAKVSRDLDGKHVVFREVIEGFKILHKMEAVIIVSILLLCF